MTRMYEMDADEVWPVEDTSLKWMFELLCDYIPNEIKHITEIKYPGPRGTSVFREKGYEHHICPLGNMEEWPENNTILVALPPCKATALRMLLDSLRLRRDQPFAIWAPLSLLQKSYLREPEIDLIVPKGRRGYGANSRDFPVNGAWITHGMNIGRNVLLSVGERNGKVNWSTLRGIQLPSDIPKTVNKVTMVDLTSEEKAEVRTIKNDWEEWTKEVELHSRGPLPLKVNYREEENSIVH